MSSRHIRDEKRLSKQLTVTSKCLAIVLAEKEKYGDENSATLESTVSVVHNGKELLEDFKLRNKTCYWNPALVESIRNLGYKGFVEPSTILVIGNEIHLENLRTAWGRRLLKAPAGFTIERIGDVNGIEMQVIPQTQFIPLPDALCLIIMDLNNRRIVATLDTIKEKLVEWYREMTVPNDQLIFDTLGALIRERKVFHSGTGYFVVTPETYRLTSDDQNVTFNTSWLPYHPMYIPVFPQIQNVPSQLQHLHHLQHFKHQQEQQQLHMRAPMRSISCQADMNGKAQAHHCPAGMGKDITENKKAGKQRPRSQSMRGLRTRERDMDRNKATVIENDDALKRTISVKYKTDKVKAINKDINLKTSNINQDKEKGTMRQILLLALLAVLFSAVFAKGGRRQQRQDVQNDVADDIEEGGEESEDEEEEIDPYAEDKRLRMRIDLCKKKKCYRGEVCRLNNWQQAECVCLTDCEPEYDPRYHVCSTKNQTYSSECELDRDHCLCKMKQPGCSNNRLNKIQLDYFGACRKLTKCPDNEFEEFPIRMKEWLFLVMKQLASRDELGEYIDLLDKAKSDANHTEAVLWKFCDLDSSPQDRQVSRRELQYIVQSLKAWEHCLVPFLAMCDQDSNRKITLSEWGACLGVNSKNISDRCIDIRARAKRH